MVSRSSSVAVSVRIFFGHSGERPACAGTIPDSSTLTSGYGSVLIGHSTLTIKSADAAVSVNLDVRSLDHRRPAVDLAVDARPEFGRTIADRFHQLRCEFIANPSRPKCFYHRALNFRNDGFR